MKLKQKIVAVLTAISLMCSPPITAYAASVSTELPSKQVIARTIFGAQSAKLTKVTDHIGGTDSYCNQEALIIVDPRLTGSFTVEKAAGAVGMYSVLSYRYGGSVPSDSVALRGSATVCTLNGFGVVREYLSSWSDRPVQYVVTYTPTEEDIKNKVILYEDYSQSAHSSTHLQTIYNNWYEELEPGVPVVLDYTSASKPGPVTHTRMGNVSVGICCGDILNYAQTGIFITNPTSSFPSITKKYGDAPFSAGFATNSDGTVSYVSSNHSVATISSTGLITITGVGQVSIQATTPETASYFADSKVMTLTVNKGTISISASPTASSIEYGQTLASSALTGGSVQDQAGNMVAGGVWSWQSPTTKPTSAGTASYAVVCTVNSSRYE